MIWVSGEALIDQLPTGPVPGGGPANTAVALARLGLDVHFVGGLSSDSFGQMLAGYLEESSVDLSLAPRSELPTAMAIVSLGNDGSASYEFLLENTATFSFDKSTLPTGKPKILHIGSLGTVVQPAADLYFDWATSLQCPVVFDPNVRPAVISDVSQYRAGVEKWAAISDVIKLSDEDLAFLYPSMAQGEAIDHLMKGRCRLVVVTRGKDGLFAVTSNQRVEVPGVPVSVVDTVGAGDTVGAVIVEALALGVDLYGPALPGVLARAAKAASITCSRAGCNPPTAAELL